MGQDEVYRYLLDHPNSPKEDIAKATGTNPMSIHVYLSKLAKWGKVSYSVRQKKTVHGRKVSYYVWYVV